MVMSIGFINALQHQYPGALISVIAKKGIHGLLDFFPPLHHRFVFSKEEHKGVAGAWLFGRMIRKTENFDLFFCLPDSFSSALVGYATGAKKRIGHKKELRQLLLTHSYRKGGAKHRVREYIDLLTFFTEKSYEPGTIDLLINPVTKTDTIVVNINSEASSRRLPLEKAVSLLGKLRQRTGSKLVLVGGKADVEFVEEVMKRLPDKSNFINIAGKTSLHELVKIIAAAGLVLTTDSGPAHVANASGVQTIVLFGAGNENNTAPFNKTNRTIIRLGTLDCEPCVKNKCLLYGIPKCLQLLDETMVIDQCLRKKS